MKKNKIFINSLALTLTLAPTLTAFASTGWVSEGDSWRYLNSRNEYVTDSWQRSGDYNFYLDENGKMAKNSLIENNDNFYAVDKNGVMLSNAWGYFTSDDSGDGHWYYFGSNGRAKKTGFETINGKRYHFTDSKMDTGWVTVGENTYFFNDEAGSNAGQMTTGWKYFENIDDNDKNSNQPTEAGWYYFEANGKMVHGKEKKINGAFYAFNQEGRMLDNWVDVPQATGSNAVYKFYNTDNGSRVEGWKYLDDKDAEDGRISAEGWYYFKNGVPYSANYKTTKIADGFGVAKIGSKIYCFDEDGKMVTGKVDSDTGNKYFYFDEKNGDMKYGRVRLSDAEDLDDNDYYFVEKGGLGIKGKSFTGVNKQYLYSQGMLVKAEDSRYRRVFVDNKEYLVNTAGRIMKKGTYKDSDEGIKYTVDIVNGEYVITQAAYN